MWDYKASYSPMSNQPLFWSIHRCSTHRRDILNLFYIIHITIFSPMHSIIKNCWILSLELGYTASYFLFRIIRRIYYVKPDIWKILLEIFYSQSHRKSTHCIICYKYNPFKIFIQTGCNRNILKNRIFIMNPLYKRILFNRFCLFVIIQSVE